MQRLHRPHPTTRGRMFRQHDTQIQQTSKNEPRNCQKIRKHRTRNKNVTQRVRIPQHARKNCRPHARQRRMRRQLQTITHDGSQCKTHGSRALPLSTTYNWPQSYFQTIPTIRLNASTQSTRRCQRQLNSTQLCETTRTKSSTQRANITLQRS